MIELKIISLTKGYIDAKKKYCDLAIENPDEVRLEKCVRLQVAEGKLLMECIRLYGDK